MDEALEAAELVADSGLEGVVIWLLRAVVGLALIVVPGVLLALVEPG